MEWNFFRRNRERGNNNKGYVGRAEVFRKNYDVAPEKEASEEPTQAVINDEEVNEASLDGIQGGYPSENPVDREWFYEKQQRAVNTLGEDPFVTRARESASRAASADRYVELGGPEDFATFTAYVNGEITDEELQAIVESKKASEHQRS